MKRVLAMAAAVTAVVAADASAAGRLRARGGCSCPQPASTPVYAAPQPTASCGGVVGGWSPGLTMQGVGTPGVTTQAPAAVPTPVSPATPVAPGAHHH